MKYRKRYDNGWILGTHYRHMYICISVYTHPPLWVLAQKNMLKKILDSIKVFMYDCRRFDRNGGNVWEKIEY